MGFLMRQGFVAAPTLVLWNACEMICGLPVHIQVLAQHVQEQLCYTEGLLSWEATCSAAPLTNAIHS